MQRTALGASSGRIPSHVLDNLATVWLERRALRDSWLSALLQGSRLPLLGLQTREFHRRVAPTADGLLPGPGLSCPSAGRLCGGLSARLAGGRLLLCPHTASPCAESLGAGGRGAPCPPPLFQGPQSYWTPLSDPHFISLRPKDPAAHTAPWGSASVCELGGTQFSPNKGVRPGQKSRSRGSPAPRWAFPWDSLPPRLSFPSPPSPSLPPSPAPFAQAFPPLLSDWLLMVQN